MGIVRNRFFKWCTSSLLGHLVLMQVCFSLPLLAFFLPTIYLQGDLTVAWALYMVFASMVLGAVCAVIFWYAVTSPLIKSRDGPK
jgi:hypothetical protein